MHRLSPAPEPLSLNSAFLQPSDFADFEEKGYAVLRGFLSPQEVKALLHAFMEEAENGPVPGLSDMSGSKDPQDPLSRFPRMMNPHRHGNKEVGRLSREHLLSPRLQALIERLYGEPAIAVQTMFYFKPPGARGQAFHQDNFYLRVNPGTCLAAWMALDDADAGNGALALAEGSHRLEIRCPETADASLSFTKEHVTPPSGMSPVMVDLKAGDMLLFDGNLIHGSQPNLSRDRFRRSFIAHFAPASSTEISEWYQALDFEGHAVELAKNVNGGPCGNPVAGPH